MTSPANQDVEFLKKEVSRLKGTLTYIEAQARTRPSGDSLTLVVIERNANAALNGEFQQAAAVAVSKTLRETT